MRKTAVVCLAISAGCASVFVSQAAASSAPAKRARDADRSKTTLDGTTRGKTAAPIFVRGELGDVLAASKDEPWHASVERNAARLSREGARVGIAARFVNLGHVGHMYVAEDPAVLRDAIAWASAP